MWPRFTSPETGFHLAITGAISDRVYDWGEMAAYLIRYLQEYREGLLAKQYGLENDFGQEEELLKVLARKWGFLQTGGITDTEKAALRLLQDFRQGKLGRITLEKAPR